MFAIDLHTHTRFFHWNPGSPTQFDPVGARLLRMAARWRGLDGIALTNHDYYHPYEGTEVLSIPGIEVSTTEGDVLVVGPDPPVETPPGKHAPAAVTDRAHDRGCAAILAHPYRDSTVADSGAAVDAVEVNGKHPRRRERVERLAGELGVPLVGGSDAHFPFEVGRAYTVVEADTLTAEAVVEAILDGRVETRVKHHFLDRVLRELYRGIHAFKGHTF